MKRLPHFHFFSQHRRAMTSSHRTVSDVIVIEDAWTALRALRDSLPRSTSSWLARFSMASHPDRPWGLWSGALLLTLLIHSLLITSFMLGTGRSARHPPLREGFHAMEQNANGTEFVSTLILLNDSSISPPDQTNDSAYKMDTPSEDELKLKDSLIIAATEPGPPAIPTFEVETDASSASDNAMGDGAEAAMLFGRYMGQVKARIERAWEFPASPSHTTFKCKAQIRQARNGEVQDITLQQCDPQGEWQASLFKAIQTASPLSAPPSEKVFTDIITLNFEAEVSRQSLATPRTAQNVSIHDRETSAARVRRDSRVSFNSSSPADPVALPLKTH